MLSRSGPHLHIPFLDDEAEAGSIGIQRAPLRWLFRFITCCITKRPIATGQDVKCPLSKPLSHVTTHSHTLVCTQPSTAPPPRLHSPLWWVSHALLSGYIKRHAELSFAEHILCKESQPCDSNQLRVGSGGCVCRWCEHSNRSQPNQSTAPSRHGRNSANSVRVRPGFQSRLAAQLRDALTDHRCVTLSRASTVMLSAPSVTTCTILSVFPSLCMCAKRPPTRVTIHIIRNSHALCLFTTRYRAQTLLSYRSQKR